MRSCAKFFFPCGGRRATRKNLPSARRWSTASVCPMSNPRPRKLRLLTTVEHFRQELLMHGVIAKQFALDLSQKLSTLYYTDNTAPYFCAELVSVWKIPSVNREAFAW